MELATRAYQEKQAKSRLCFAHCLVMSNFGWVPNNPATSRPPLYATPPTSAPLFNSFILTRPLLCQHLCQVPCLQFPSSCFVHTRRCTTATAIVVEAAAAALTAKRGCLVSAFALAEVAHEHETPAVSAAPLPLIASPRCVAN